MVAFRGFRGKGDHHRGVTSLLQKLPFNVSKSSNGAEVDPDGDSIDPYETRPSKPGTQLAFRIGLWVAVGFGCVGGILALLGLSSREGDTVVMAGGETEARVPAPVASVAEQAVETWLSPSEGDEELLEVLFVEPPERFGEGTSGLTVGPATVVSGGQWQDGYWLVTLAVDVYECVPDTEDDDVADDADSPDNVDSVPRSAEDLIDCSELEDDENAGSNGNGDENDDESTVGQNGDEDGEEDFVGQVNTWFVEVGVVGDLEDRVAALSTPAIVGAPPAVSDAWQSTGRDAASPEAGEPIAETVERFLNAWLAGDGDMSRYLAQDVRAELVEPAPFSALTLAEIAYEELEEGHVRTRAYMQATTTGGSRVEVAYEVEVIFDEDRWEVSVYYGAPTLVAQPVEEEPAEEEADGGDPDGGSSPP